ncbi:hypothetical protein [Antricoccus suffuscus]|uniref:hypothetical protein n=1 Tax=Antricoccus suffuscus TaxID=1629062 RepID=UPI001472BF76|nr:hypothetical protein [Antricoccus suffuscus]
MTEQEVFAEPLRQDIRISEITRLCPAEQSQQFAPRKFSRSHGRPEHCDSRQIVWWRVDFQIDQELVIPIGDEEAAERRAVVN